MIETITPAKKTFYQRYASSAIALMLLASFLFAGMTLIAKQLSSRFEAVELVFFRNLVGVISILISLRQKPMQQPGGKPLLLIFRGVVGTASLYMLFYSVRTLSLGTASAYQYTYPIFLSILSFLFFGEKLNRREWLAIGLGFLGILLIFRPDVTMPLRWHLIGLSCAILTAVSYLSIRSLNRYYDTRAIVLSFMLSGLILPALSMLTGSLFPDVNHWLIGRFVWPQGWEWAILLMMGLAALLAQLCMTRSLSMDKAGRVSAVGYSNIVFSLLFGIILGDPLPSFVMSLGITLIISGGVLIAWKKKTDGKLS
ncbi:DMT family transporter [Siphonobacter sp. SORGH_AS_1065]|uniref:DMT family transporter n=1 Tax=Siphonobacter sp. SORGH_AS_1065 TaxID=3041795 RepID=UPI00278973DC|nr:DMT family transporter [Siphonobacter sp. SORGH_AS_1065]MDQ1087894.1 drug/metabolite transporter (DMT)-like permease [Siphonobacter sp. SORGH_AS_1065]